MQKYIRGGVASIEEVLPQIVVSNKKSDVRVLIKGEMVKVGSLRLQTFAKHGTTCSACGLKATHFALEKNAETYLYYHLNLYGVNSEGEEVLFTHDHTLARCLGGKDNIENTTTMCSPCNSAKAVIEHNLVKQRREAEIA